MKSINSAYPSGRSIGAVVVAGAIIAMLAGCGGGGGGGGGGNSSGGGTPVTNVKLSGTVTWSGNNLANRYVYDQQTPSIWTTTNSSGQYSLTVPASETITLVVQETATTGDGCTQSQMPTDFSQSVTVGSASTQTANLATTSSNPPPPPLCSGS